MNNLDKQYTTLLQDILDNGHQKGDRTGTGTISVFGRQIRHNMKDGFPLLTTKKLHWKSIVGELLWFLKGSTDIRDLWKDNISIWDGDWYKKYETSCSSPYTLEEIKQKVKTGGHAFHDSMFNLGLVYGKQWRNWTYQTNEWYDGKNHYDEESKTIDQIANLIRDLKTNPDSRRLMVNAWNVGELDSMTLPPCHYGFQVYTRELSWDERHELAETKYQLDDTDEELDKHNIPTRAISLMWNQRSVDTFLGLPFNIASYGLLLEIIAKAVNMVPDELIGNLGDTHLYLDHIEQAKEQIGRSYTYEERNQMLKESMGEEEYKNAVSDIAAFGGGLSEYYDSYKIPKRTREPYPLPTLNINTEFWPYEGGECGIGHIDAVKVFEAFKDENFCRCLLEEDIQLGNYQSHPTIKAPLSN